MVKHYLRIVKAIFLFIALGAIFLFAWSNRRTLINIVNNADLFYLMQSVFLWALLHSITPLFSSIMFKGLAEKLNYVDAFYIHASRLPAKYLPGGIWHSVARIEGYRDAGIAPKNVALYLLIENLQSAGVTLCLGGLIVFYYYQGIPILSSALISIILLSIGGLVATPYVISRRFSTRDLSIPFIKSYFVGVSVISMFWLGAGWSFLQFIQSLPESGISISAI